MTATGRRPAARRTGAGVLRRLSLRARLVCLTVALLAACLVACDLVMLASLRDTLVERVDRQLDGIAGLAAASDPAQLGASPGNPTPRRGFSPDVISDIYLVIVGPDGVPRYALRSGEHPTGALPSVPRLVAEGARRRPGRPWQTRSAGGVAWRAVARPWAVHGGGTVLVAASLTGVDSIMARARLRFASIGLVALAVMAALGYVAIRIGLRPLRHVEETSAAIIDGDLGRRISDLAPPNTELGRLGAALNRMLAEIESAIAARTASERRLREFVSDASHELRTPLAGIKGFADLYRMGAFPERADVDRTMDHIERESGRLARIIDHLLLLARLDERSAGLRLQLAPVDLQALAVEAWHTVRALDPSREATLTGPGGGPTGEAPTVGDEQRLWQVVSNLVGNAVAHTPAGSPIRIGVGTVADSAVVEVADRGPGLTPEQAARVFERFYRTDASRSRRDGGGAGLGLSIARSLVAAHGGRIDLVTEPGAGATFRVVLPRAAGQPPPE